LEERNALIPESLDNLALGDCNVEEESGIIFVVLVFRELRERVWPGESDFSIPFSCQEFGSKKLLGVDLAG
jgi:hypothetical protein